MAESSKYDMNLSLRQVELNTLLMRINKRRIAEPTTAERERIQQLQVEIRELRSGKAFEPGEGISSEDSDRDGGDTR